MSERKRGPVPGPETKTYGVCLTPELAEWGKKQPGGLSALCRRLLESEQIRLLENPRPDAADAARMERLLAREAAANPGKLLVSGEVPQRPDWGGSRAPEELNRDAARIARQAAAVRSGRAAGEKWWCECGTMNRPGQPKCVKCGKKRGE